MLNSGDLPLQLPRGSGTVDSPVVVVVGEILWDVFPETVCLGGAPLNFAANALRLGLYPVLISALGQDDLGRDAAGVIETLGLNPSMVRWSSKWNTGTASVLVDADGHPTFTIARPAAYDEVSLSPTDLCILTALEPEWLYYGTLYACRREGRSTLERLMQATPSARRFYDVNLRPGFDSLELVTDLLTSANVVKLNEPEARRVAEHLALPLETEAFCRAAAAHFEWRAVCVSLGERGCALFDGTSYVEAAGEAIHVVDTVGAGDAFSAAVVHGLTEGWSASRIARFANRLGALVASRAGAMPDWSIAEAITP